VDNVLLNMTSGPLTIKTAESEWRLVNQKRPIAVGFNSDSPTVCVPAYQPENRTVWNVGARLLVDSVTSTTSSVRLCDDGCLYMIQ
jgi:hypothetical protein